MRYIDNVAHPDDFIGVFTTDLALDVIQPYTIDKDLVRKAINTAASTVTASRGSRGDELHNLASSQPATISLAPPKYDVENRGAAVRVDESEADKKIREMQAASIDAFERLQNSQQGYATTNGLLAVVKGLDLVPGRKAILFISAGIDIPPSVVSHFQAVVNAANRAGVSIYTVDAAGLRVDSSRANALREINDPPSQLGISQPALRGSERIETALRSSSESSLGSLAKQTGGIFISDTNDPSKLLPQIEEDLSTHYIISYVPKNRNFDGQFRSVIVKSKKPDLIIRSREGYFAISNIGNLDVLPNEARPLAVLGNKLNVSSFPIALSGYHFRTLSNSSLASIVVEIPSRILSTRNDNKTGTFEIDATIVGLVRDSNDEIISKLSQKYELRGNISDLRALMEKNILFYRELSLKPGKYSVEVAAHDAISGKISTSRTPLDIPDRRGKAELSSIIIISNADKLEANNQRPESPFQYESLLLYPNSSKILHRSTTKNLPFFITLYTNSEDSRHILSVEILQAGATLAHLQSDTLTSDKNGRVRFAGAIPIDSLPSGQYELKISTQSAVEIISESTPFKIEP